MMTVTDGGCGCCRDGADLFFMIGRWQWHAFDWSWWASTACATLIHASGGGIVEDTYGWEMSSCVCCYPTNSCERDTGRGCAYTSDQMDHANNACVAYTEAKGSAAPVMMMMMMTEIVSPTSRPNQIRALCSTRRWTPHWTLSGLVTKQTPFLEKHTHTHPIVRACTYESSLTQYD